MRPTPIVVVMLCGMLAPPAGGQDTSTATPDAQRTFANDIEVTVANIDVFVRDRDGRPVMDLTADDFRVLQDGVEMQISNFTSVATERTDASRLRPESDAPRQVTGEASPEPITPARVVVIFDDENLFPTDRVRVMNGVRAFVDEVMASRAEAEVMVLSTRRSVTVVQPFTTDREAIVLALDRVSGQSGARMALERERRRIMVELERFANQAARESYFEFLDDIDTQVFKAQMQGRITSHVEQESGILRDTIRNLREVVRMVSDGDGRCSIVYVSNGLAMTPGLELMHEFAEVFLDNTVYTRISRRSFAPDFRALADDANRERVSLYTVDASGLKPPLGFGADDRYVPRSTASWVATANQQDSMGYMADATGGVAVLNSNDVTEGLRRVREDLGNFYSIGYPVTATGQDTSHRIEIELPDHPDYTIRHRKWFVERSLETRVRERVLQALIRDVGYNPLGLRLRTGEPVEVGAHRWEVPLVLSIPVNRLAVRPDGGDLIARVELYFCVRDEHGRESPMHQRELDLRVPRDGFSPERELRYEVTLQMVFRDEHHAIAVGLVDRDVQQTSYQRTEVDIP